MGPNFVEFALVIENGECTSMTERTGVCNLAVGPVAVRRASSRVGRRLAWCSCGVTRVEQCDQTHPIDCFFFRRDNDNDTLKEVPHPSNEGLALQARVSGPWPHKKESVLLVELARWQGVQQGKNIANFSCQGGLKISQALCIVAKVAAN